MRTPIIPQICRSHAVGDRCVITHPGSQGFDSFEQGLRLTPSDLPVDGVKSRARSPMLPFMPGVSRVIRLAHEALFVGQMAVDFGCQRAAKQLEPGRLHAVKQRLPQFGRPIEHFPVLRIDIRNLNRVFIRPLQTSHDPILGYGSLQSQAARMRPAGFFMR